MKREHDPLESLRETRPLESTAKRRVQQDYRRKVLALNLELTEEQKHGIQAFIISKYQQLADMKKEDPNYESISPEQVKVEAEELASETVCTSEISLRIFF